jgi:hypothetical protein
MVGSTGQGYSADTASEAFYRGDVGHRASYAIVENGRVDLFFSRWGAETIVADMLAGPAAATAWIRPAEERTPPPADDLPARLLWNGPDPDTELLDDVYCEGAALIDHDRHVLLLFQWMEDYGEFVDGMAGLVAAWPGWQVRWAFDGIGDLAAHIGQDRSTVRGDREKAAGLDAFYGPAQRAEFRINHGEDWDDYYNCVLSVRHEDGSLAFYLSGLDFDAMAFPSPASFEELPPGFPTLDCPETPRSGIHVDFRSRTGGVWTIDAMCGYYDDPHSNWPDWRWTFWGGDIRHQLAGCDGRLAVPALDADTR